MIISKNVIWKKFERTNRYGSKLICVEGFYDGIVIGSYSLITEIQRKKDSDFFTINIDHIGLREDDEIISLSVIKNSTENLNDNFVRDYIINTHNFYLKNGILKL